jgi:hypothetical protein
MQALLKMQFSTEKIDPFNNCNFYRKKMTESFNLIFTAKYHQSQEISSGISYLFSNALGVDQEIVSELHNSVKIFAETWVERIAKDSSSQEEEFNLFHWKLRPHEIEVIDFLELLIAKILKT